MNIIDIPREVLDKILSYVADTELDKICKLSKFFNNLIIQDKQHIINNYYSIYSRPYKTYTIINSETIKENSLLKDIFKHINDRDSKLDGLYIVYFDGVVISINNKLYPIGKFNLKILRVVSFSYEPYIMIGYINGSFSNKTGSIDPVLDDDFLFRMTIIRDVDKFLSILDIHSFEQLNNEFEEASAESLCFNNLEKYQLINIMFKINDCQFHNKINVNIIHDIINIIYINFNLGILIMKLHLYYINNKENGLLEGYFRNMCNMYLQLTNLEVCEEYKINLGLSEVYTKSDINKYNVLSIYDSNIKYHIGNLGSFSMKRDGWTTNYGGKSSINQTNVFNPFSVQRENSFPNRDIDIKHNFPLSLSDYKITYNKIGTFIIPGTYYLCDDISKKERENEYVYKLDGNLISLISSKEDVSYRGLIIEYEKFYCHCMNNFKTSNTIGGYYQNFQKTGDNIIPTMSLLPEAYLSYAVYNFIYENQKKLKVFIFYNINGSGSINNINYSIGGNYYTVSLFFDNYGNPISTDMLDFNLDSKLRDMGVILEPLNDSDNEKLKIFNTELSNFIINNNHALHFY